MRCSAIITSLMTNLPVSQKTGKSTTSGSCVTCRSSLATWLHPDCSTTSLGDSGNSSGIAKTHLFWASAVCLVTCSWSLAGSYTKCSRPCEWGIPEVMSDLLPQAAFLCCFQPAVGTTAVELKTQSMIMSVFTTMSMPHQYRSLVCPRLYSYSEKKKMSKGGKKKLVDFFASSFNVFYSYTSVEVDVVSECLCPQHCYKCFQSCGGVNVC